MSLSLEEINAKIIACNRCPRLRDHCQKVAREKRASFANDTYWGLPVPNFSGKPKSGNKSVEILIAGLAPAAHGANRTGQMFTGDRSGDFLFKALHQSGLANQPSATSINDGLQLYNCLITSAAHCAPPGNKPTRQELNNCSDYLHQTFDALDNLKVIVCLGKMGHDAILRLYKQRRWITALAHYRFAHGAVHQFEHHSAAIICDTFHPSQQNTFTGKLTMDMLTQVFQTALQLT